MPAVIEFDYDADRLRAMEALDETDETYQCIPRRCFLISNTAVNLLREREIRFRVIGGHAREREQRGLQMSQ